MEAMEFPQWHYLQVSTHFLSSGLLSLHSNGSYIIAKSVLSQTPLSMSVNKGFPHIESMDATFMLG
jgi:hypothetical protein